MIKQIYKNNDHPLIQLHADALASTDEAGRPLAGFATRSVLLKEGSKKRISGAKVFNELSDFIKNNMDRVWLLSDLHLGHNNIIRYSERPFENLEDMDAHLSAAAENIPDGDWLMVLGDVRMGNPNSAAKFLSKIPDKSVLIFGNHDIRKSQGEGHIHVELIRSFKASAEAMAVDLDGQRLLFSHYPIPTDMLPDDVLNIHGHTHTHPALSHKHRNVCVEHTNYRPVRLSDVISNEYLKTDKLKITP